MASDVIGSIQVNLMSHFKSYFIKQISHYKLALNKREAASNEQIFACLQI
jgi:hypothetical protein